MSALDLFLHLTVGGCTLSRLEGDRLQIRDPQHILNDALRQQIREHKAALLDVHFISSPPVKQRPACMAWADKRLVQSVEAEG